MTPLYLVFIPFCISLLLVAWIHPRLVKIANLKNIVDNPDARKLQRTPVPVLGGVAVFFGVVVSMGCMAPVMNGTHMLVIIMAMMAMLYTGTMDDILNLSPAFRFLVEIIVILLLIFVGGYSIDDFHTLWGIGQIPVWAAIPLTVFAATGIINAINLIDGVNGLSSGFCIMACILFGVLFFLAGDTPMAILAAVSGGALIPFFMHNVFGKTSKMFIGDGGTLVMGGVMSVFVIAVLKQGSLSASYVSERVGLVAFTLAVLSVPVFDIPFPTRQDASAPYVHRAGLFACGYHRGHPLHEFSYRPGLVAAHDSRGLGRYAVLRRGGNEPARHVRNLPFHAVAYPTKHALPRHNASIRLQNPCQPHRNFHLASENDGQNLKGNRVHLSIKLL